MGALPDKPGTNAVPCTPGRSRAGAADHGHGVSRMSVFGWLNDQLLRMTWLNDLVGQGVVALGLDPSSRLGGSVQFFVYDVIKIFILLSVLIFAISWVQSHFPPERTR